MSLSGLIEQDFILKLAALQAVLDKYQARRNNADTWEEQLVIEAEALEMYRAIVEQDIQLDSVTHFDHPDKLNFENAYLTYEMVERANSLRIQKLMSLLVARENNQRIATAELIGQVKRIKQKHAVLNLWDGDKARYFVGNKFLTTEGLDDRFTSLDPCEVNTAQGLLTLPIQSRIPASPVDVRIGATSNGQPGSSDLAISSGNQNLRALIQADSPDSFEYERLDSGPCDLTLIVELSKPQIVNLLTILPVDIGVPVAFEIVDVVFTSSIKASTSIHQLLSPQKHEAFQVSVATLGEPWELAFLPTEAVSVSITLRQTQAYQVETATTDGGTAYRDRYVIPLKRIALEQVQYKSSGGINSKPIQIRKNLYAIEPVIKVTPDNINLYDITLETSFDDGSTWKIAATDDDSHIVLIEPNQGSFLWRVSLQRNDAAFSTFTSFFEADQPVGKIRSIVKSASRFSSPFTIGLTSEPADTNIQVFQPKVARRGNKDKALRVGTTGPGVTKVKLPFRAIGNGVKPANTKLYVGGVEYARREAGAPLSAMEWSFTDDHEQVMLGPDLPAGTPIDVALDEELLLLEEREDGYYHQMRFGFDPEKENIELHYLSKEPSRQSVLIPKGETVVFLGVKNVINGTVVLSSANGTTYTEVFTRDDVFDEADNDFYVDYLNGVLYLASSVGDDNVRAGFDYQTQRELSKDDFEISYEGNKPWGLRIKKDALEATTTEETIADEPLSVINVVTGEYAPRPVLVPNGATTKKQLTMDSIIKGTFNAPVDLLENNLLPEEVDFIDGVTEFLGLTQITNESTVAIEANGNGVVSFSLSARALWYKDLGLSASNTNVFGRLRNSVAQVNSGDRGDYYVNDEGTVFVQVNTGSTLPAGIKLNYYSKDPNFDPANKFSVDYINGILFTHSALNQQALVTYKSAAYKTSYDVSIDLAYEYDSVNNSVRIRTEKLHPVNNQIKIIWTESPVSQVTPTLRQYFSPLIDLIGFRFS